MTTIELSSGDTDQIIPNDQANREYLMSVSGSSVLIGHSERYAKDGTEIKAGDRVSLSNLQGDSLYAYAPSGAATIEIDEASADVTYMPRSSTANVTRLETVEEVLSSDVSDRSARELGKARLEDSSGTLIDPATDSAVTSEQPRSVSELSNTSTVSAEAIDPTNSFSATSVPDGMTARVKASSGNGSAVTVAGAYTLQPGDEVELRVTSLADIPVSGTSGDEVQAIVPGGS